MFVKQECPQNGHLYLTSTFADDLDLGTSRCILMRYAFLQNMCRQTDGQTDNSKTIPNKELTLSQTTNFRLFQIERGCRRQFQI